MRCFAFAMMFFGWVFDALAGTPPIDGKTEADQLYAYWRCAVLAQLLKDEAAYKRHFDAGYVSGVRALATVSGAQSQKEAMLRSAELPIELSVKIGGPSADFALGRVLESLHNERIRIDAANFTLAEMAADYLGYIARQNQIWNSDYKEANCHLLR